MFSNDISFFRKSDRNGKIKIGINITYVMLNSGNIHPINELPLKFSYALPNVDALNESILKIFLYSQCS